MEKKTTYEILKEFKHHIYIESKSKVLDINDYRDLDIKISPTWSKSNVEWVRVDDIIDRLESMPINKDIAQLLDELSQSNKEKSK